MIKIGKAFKALGLIIRDPWKLNLILDQNETWQKYTGKKYKRLSLPVIPLDALIYDPLELDPLSFLDGGSLPTDIALLKQLASDMPGCKYFEIGTWRGESVSNVSAVAGHCYTLNLPDEEVFRQINDPNYVSSHRIFSRNLKNVTHLYGNSATFKFSDLNQKFDLIFIDGDHHYDAIVRDTRNILRHLCHAESVVVWHDYAYTPESIRYETLAAILDGCPEDLHTSLFHVKNTNCAMLYRRQTDSYPFEKFGIPGYSFNVRITINPLRST